ncbi:major capsid protein [Actinobacillus pleuropneumoniae]|uniref:major capsid protein n=1 Tax=Actinobacillus pleuropneumoniae TaxID=715 RepID=UPI00384E79F9
MERIIFNKNLIANSMQVQQAWNQLLQQRHAFNVNQQEIAQKYGAMEANQAALVSSDYWREVDSITTRVFRNDEGNGLLDDLLGLGQSISIGKTVAMYRVSSDAGKVTRSMSGQSPDTLDKVIYDEYGDPIPIFKTGYAREWREWSGMLTENLDVMADDQEAHVAALRRDMANYVLNGDSGIVVKGYSAKGITNHENTNQVSLGTGGANIDLTKADADKVVAFFVGEFAKVLSDNNTTEKVKLWVSPEIMRNFDRPYSQSAGFKEGTIKDYVLRYARIESINETHALSGNHMIGYVRNSQFIKTRIAAPVGSFMNPRVNPHDNYETLVWSAFGLQIKRDFAGKSKVFNFKGD